MITEKQSKMIELMIQGWSVTDIAKEVGVNRGTIYCWKERDDVIIEMNRRKNDLRKAGNQRILYKLDNYIENIQKIAQDTSDKRTCLEANKYLINRIYGSPTTNISEDSEKKGHDDEVDTDILKDKLKEMKLKVVK